MSPLHLAAHLGQDEFLAQVLHRHYRHVPQALPTPQSLISWDDLNALLATHRLEPPRLRLSIDGEMLPQYRYTTPVVTRRHTVWHRLHPADLHARLAEGATLVLDNVDELHPPIGGAAMELERWLRTGVQTNLYASWTATEGFGTHWDDHDVLVIQVDGTKRWRLYGPTRVAPMYKDTQTPEPPPAEPLTELVLRPGDLLYLPRGWWHAVAASEGERSLHLTFGLQTTTGAQLLAWLADDLRDHEILRTDLPLHATPEEQAAHLHALRAVVSDSLAEPDLFARYATARDAADLTRLAPSLPHVAGLPLDDDLAVRLTTARANLRTTSEGTVFQACDNEWLFAERVAPLLQRLIDACPGSVPLAELAAAAHLPPDDALTVVQELADGQAVAARGGTT